jgi:hypothetical protein
VFINWFLGREAQDLFSRAMGQGTRRLDVNTKWLSEVGVIAAKDIYALKNTPGAKTIRRRKLNGSESRVRRWQGNSWINKQGSGEG